jgi:uncharacterized small protein (DUF1192 family)
MLVRARSAAICAVRESRWDEERGTMRDDDDRPKKKITHEIGQDLSLLSVFELRERIALLTEEIARLEVAAAAKDSAKNAAAAFFKS